MADFRTKDGKVISAYDMTYGRLDVGTGRIAIPVECESVRVKAGNGNGAVLVYVGGADVDVDNGYELAAGDSITIGFGLGGYYEADSIYLTASAPDVEIFYIAYN